LDTLLLSTVMSGFAIDFSDTQMEVERPKFTTKSSSRAVVTSQQKQQQPQGLRKVIVTSRGAKQQQSDSDSRVSFNTNSITAAAAPSAGGFVVSAANGGKRSVAKKRRSADVTTFTRTITNDDMQDDPDPSEQEGSEAAPKRGKVGRGETLPASVAPTFALPTPAPVKTLSRVQASAGQPEIKRPAAAAPTPTPVAPVSAPMQVSSATGPRVTVLLRNLAPGVDGTLLGKQILGIFNYDQIIVDTDPATHACLGTAEVLFEHEADALEAVQLCQGQLVLGKPLRMSILREKTQVETPEEKEEREKREREREQRRKEQERSAQQAAQQQPALQPKQATHVPKSLPLYAPSAAAAASFAPIISFSSSPSASLASSSPPLASPAAAGPILSSQPLNLGFAWDKEVDGATAAGAGVQVGSALNQPFVWGNERDDSVQLNATGNGVADTIFNITNLRGAQGLSEGSAGRMEANQPQLFSVSAHRPVAQPKRLEVKPKGAAVSSVVSAVGAHAGGGGAAVTRPKSVVLSGSDAMAGVKRLHVVPKGATTDVPASGARPSITLSKRA
jgi:hypothetical protein